MLLFGALIGAQEAGFSNPYILGAILLAIVILALFIYLEKKKKQPLLDISLFKSQLFSMSLICALISFVCIAAYTFLFPFYLQDTHKISPSDAGLLMMISPIIIALLSAFCGTLADKIGAEILTLIGLLIMSVSFFLMSFLNLHSGMVACAAFLAIMAVGQSFFQPANNSLIMSACPKDKLGIGGSVNSLVRNLGQYLGIVLSTTFLYCFMSGKIGHTVTDYVKGRDDVFVFGMKNDYLILMVLCLLGALLTAFRFAKARRKNAQEIE